MENVTSCILNYICYYVFMKILLKDIRGNKRLSLRQVEYLTGISRSALSRIERGDVSPSMIEMEMIAAGLHMKISDLYDSQYK